MKTATLFKAMEELVNKHVEAWKNDFELDKERIKNNPLETTYYWYLRQCGTQLMSATDIKYIETGDATAAEYYLPIVRAIYEINVTDQKLTLITSEKMMDVISKAEHMTDSIKIEYLIKWMSKTDVQIWKRPWEILYHNARFYRFSHYKIDNLVNKGAGIKEILETLNELLNWAKAS